MTKASDIIPATVGVHGPYEDLAIKLLDLFIKIIESTPEAERAAMWKMYVEDMRAWRTFWSFLTPAPKPATPVPPITAPVTPPKV